MKQLLSKSSIQYSNYELFASSMSSKFPGGICSLRLLLLDWSRRDLRGIALAYNNIRIEFKQTSSDIFNKNKFEKYFWGFFSTVNWQTL